MTDRDGNGGMNAEFGWTDAEFDAALNAESAAPDALAALVATAVMEFTDPIVDEVAKHHVATSAAVARSIAHDAAAVAAAHIPVVKESTTKRRRRIRRLTFAGAFSGMWVKIALGTVALAAVGTGAAATDSLPDPIQAVFSEVAGFVGIDLPHPYEPTLDDQPAGTESESVGTESETVRTEPGSEAPGTDAPATDEPETVGTTTEGGDQPAPPMERRWR